MTETCNQKFTFRSFLYTHDGGGFPASDSSTPTLAEALNELKRVQGNGWVEVVRVGKQLATCHLVYTGFKLTKVYKFKNDL